MLCIHYLFSFRCTHCSPDSANFHANLAHKRVFPPPRRSALPTFTFPIARDDRMQCIHLIAEPACSWLTHYWSETCPPRCWERAVVDTCFSTSPTAQTRRRRELPKGTSSIREFFAYAMLECIVIGAADLAMSHSTRRNARDVGHARSTTQDCIAARCRGPTINMLNIQAAWGVEIHC